MSIELKNKNLIITCPHCGAQYHAGEIFSAVAFTGKPTEIMRDCLGRILYYEYQEGKEADALEHFVCEYCDRQFQVEAQLSFKAKEEKEELDFTNQSVKLF